MVLFLVRHEHAPHRCPAADPQRGAMLRSHLSRPNARRHGLDIVGDVVIHGEHAIYLIVESGDERRVREFMTPLAEAGGVAVHAASRCATVVTSRGCTAAPPAVGGVNPAVDPAVDLVVDPAPAGQAAGGGGLVVHRAHPLNCETSIPDLIGGVVMPTGHFYVRNHFPVPTLHPGTWRLGVGGLVARPLSLSLGDLQAMPTHTRILTVECAGNGRSLLDPAVEGEQWGLGAVSTAEWTGVALAEVLNRAGVRAGARHVLFRGADRGTVPDRPETIRFERSLSLDQARHTQPMLAYAMNGEPLPIEHGYPLRLVVPGWYGVASVKWLTEIEVLDRACEGYFQVDRYRYQRHGQTAAEPVTVQRVRALITEPVAGRQVDPGGLAVRGLAWSGAAPIARVEVSIDGASWVPARLLGPCRRDSWQRWELLTTSDRCGALTIRARATDRAGRTQPDLPEWNRLGYAANAVQRVSVDVRADNRHPRCAPTPG